MFPEGNQALKDVCYLTANGNIMEIMGRSWPIWIH